MQAKPKIESMDVVYSEPNEETVAAIKEARETKNKETFDSVESLMEELYWGGFPYYTD